MVDLIIKNGFIIDGTGGAGYYGDIAIDGDRIVRIGDLKYEIAKETIDAKGLIVAPGFIDIHSHSDWRIFSTLKTENVIRQGVTTEVVGQCGDSPFPVINHKAHEIYDYFLNQNISSDLLKWSTPREFFDIVNEVGVSHNIVPLVGHGTIRMNVMGYENRKPTDKELDMMKTLVEDAMKSGVFGISTGLPYAPGVFADIQEIIELCKVVAEYRGVYTTHLRSQSTYLIDAIQESIQIGKESGIRVNISHLKASDRDNWGKVVEAIEIMNKARENGLNIICDVYPYIAASNPLSSELPSWIHEGGTEKLIERLKDRSIREKLRNEVPKDQDEFWSLIYICDVRYDKYKKYIGKNIKEISEFTGETPLDTVCELLIKNEGVIQVNVICMSEEDVKYVLAYNFASIGADGGAFITEGYTGHPRAFGTFPTFIGKYIRDAKIVSLEEGIRKITSLPAEFIGIKDRGVIGEKMYADIVIFDYVKIADKATYEKPAEYPEGIEYVVINGKVQLVNGIYNRIAAGRIIRKNHI